MVIPRFVTQALRNEPLTVYGDGRQTRTFTYVKDVVWALMALMWHETSTGEVFNVGGIEEISILALAEKVIRLTQSKSRIQLIPYEQAFEKDFEDMQRRVPSLDKIKAAIGFQPTTDLEQILGYVIEYTRGLEQSP